LASPDVIQIQASFALKRQNDQKDGSPLLSSFASSLRIWISALQGTSKNHLSKEFVLKLGLMLE
jgi:hypothetical protein